MRECPFLPIGSGGFHLCHSSCMAYYEDNETPRCQRLDGGGTPPQPVHIGGPGVQETRFNVYCMSLVEQEAWERLARILEDKIETTLLKGKQHAHQINRKKSSSRPRL